MDQMIIVISLISKAIRIYFYSISSNPRRLKLELKVVLSRSISSEQIAKYCLNDVVGIALLNIITKYQFEENKQQIIKKKKNNLLIFAV